jgi:hypothetical protein
VDKFTAHDEDSVEAHYSCLERPAPRFEAPHGCIGGYVFIGHMVTDESGEEREIIESRPCRRCAAQSA